MDTRLQTVIICAAGLKRFQVSTGLNIELEEEHEIRHKSYGQVQLNIESRNNYNNYSD